MSHLFLPRNLYLCTGQQIRSAMHGEWGGGYRELLGPCIYPIDLSQLRQGGGWCNGLQSCSLRRSSRLGSTRAHPNSIVHSEAYFSTDPIDNPLLHNWNQVYREC
jgi:hypothetical protein